MIEWIRRLLCRHRWSVEGKSGPGLWYHSCWKCGHTEYWDEGPGDED
jgi:hypothetical protein